MKKLITTGVVILILAVVFVLLGPFFVIDAGEQAVVTRFGAIISSTETAGLKFKLPVVDSVMKYPKKILSWDGESQRIPTRENQFIWVDTTARWKIVDPAKFYEAATTLQQGYGRLDDVVDSAVRTVISDNFLIEAVRSSNAINEIQIEDPTQGQGTAALEEEGVTDQLRDLTETQTKFEEINKGRTALSDEMFDYASSFTDEYGIELIDIVIRQIRYSEDLTESVYDRMIKERNQIAEAFRSYGEGKKAEWMGRLDNDKKRILSEAYATAEEIRGGADARATNIYADSYEADTEFFEFWRILESYQRALPDIPKTLSTDMDYFNYLYTIDGMGQK